MLESGETGRWEGLERRVAVKGKGGGGIWGVGDSVGGGKFKDGLGAAGKIRRREDGQCGEKRRKR